MSAAQIQQLEQIALQRPGDASVRRRLGGLLHAQGNLPGAEAAYRDSLTLEPDSVRAHNNLGQVLLAMHDRAGAIGCYERAIALDPRYAIAHNNLGIAYFDMGDVERAVASYERALECEPAFFQAHHNCANGLVRLGRIADALPHYDRALDLSPSSVETLKARGNALQQLERYEDALASYVQALSFDSHDAEALSNCASANLALKRFDAALRSADEALLCNALLPAAHSNRGGALRALGRLPEAQQACEEALRLKPDFAQGWANLGNVKAALAEPDVALQCFDNALVAQPDLFEALEQRAALLPRQKRLDEAIRAYEVLQARRPGHKFLPGSLRHTRNLACDWRGYSENLQQIAAGVMDDRLVVPPFALLSLIDSPNLHYRCATAFAGSEVLTAAPELPLPSRTTAPRARLRVAYLSADLRQHATAMLMAGVFEAHDHSRFETIGVSFGTDDASPMRQRLQRSFDRFLDMRMTGDEEVTRILRELEIDVAVDLKGYTTDTRLLPFSRRIAPLQVSYLGYPGTLGLPQLDYVIADRVVLPPEQVRYYAEKIIWMPHSYQCNDDGRPIAEHAPTRAAAGLPESGFVFCCFNNNYKITPSVFAIWMRLLRDLPGSVLWLLGDNDAAVRNLKAEAENHGIAPARLIFAQRIDAAEHLARHRLADLFLDTLPYNAHTTASDALWAGLPLLTCLGNAFAGRVGASLLHAVGLPELVARDPAEYEARALALARDPAQLQTLRSTLARNRLSQPLFDTQRFTRHLESAYGTIWRRQLEGLPPASFAVES
jgi:protein O-GlcNAc transferase